MNRLDDDWWERKILYETKRQNLLKKMEEKNRKRPYGVKKKVWKKATYE